MQAEAGHQGKAAFAEWRQTTDRDTECKKIKCHHPYIRTQCFKLAVTLFAWWSSKSSPVHHIIRSEHVSVNQETVPAKKVAISATALPNGQPLFTYLNTNRSNTGSSSTRSLSINICANLCKCYISSAVVYGTKIILVCRVFRFIARQDVL